MKATKKVTYQVEDFETTFEPIEDSITIEKTKEGYTMKYLVRDDIPLSPREWDNLGTMVCFHRRYDLGDKHDYTVEDIKELVKREDIISLPLYLYDHSGISMRTYPHGHHVAWDCGQVGYIFVTKERIKKEYGKVTKKTIEKAIEVLKGEVENYDQYIQGDVYCCVVETYDKEKNHLDYDVVGGYYGVDYALQALKEEY